MEYTIVSSGDDKSLIDKINEMFEEGWETEGGIAISPDGNFYQAMILFEDDEDEFETGEEI